MYDLKLRCMKAFFPCVGAAILILSTASCKKGDTGPAGPAGPTGTANVIYSDWFQPATYTKDTVFGIWGFNYLQPAPKITQNVLDSGSVIVYGKLTGYNPQIWPANQVAALPINLTYVSGSTMTDTWSGLVSPGQVKIRFVNDKNYWTSIANTHRFRYIIIPGGKSVTASATAPGMVTRSGNILDAGMLRDIANNWTHMSYEEVCNKLKIPQ